MRVQRHTGSRGWEVAQEPSLPVTSPCSGQSTSPRATAGSRARLTRQPSTGVRGSSAVAMLSSLLNISDSVPPVHARPATTSHFFLRDLGGQEQTGRAVSSRISAENSLPVLPGPAQTLCPPLEHRRASLSRRFPLDLAQVLQGNAAVLGPLHGDVQLPHQPLALI